jgi:hypothetical protein
MILALLTSAAAQDVNTVLLPEFTPESVSDIAVGYMVYDQLRRELHARGITVIDGDQLRESVGDAADDCADVPDCPAMLWEHYDVPLALVGTIGAVDDGLDITVGFHQPGEGSAIASYNEEVWAGGEFGYTQEVADKTVDILKLLSMFEDRPAIVELEPAPHEDPNPEPDPVVEPDPTVDPDPVADPDPDPDPVDPTDGPFIDDPVERREMGINSRNYEIYRASGMDREAWLRDRRVRSGAFFVELTGGLILGSTDRSYSVEVILDEEADDSFSEYARYEEDVLISGTSGGGGLNIGVNLHGRVDVMLHAGLQYGRKNLATGWEHWNEATFVEDFQDAPPPAAAAVAVLEPKLRVYLIQTGMVKPYLLGGAGLRIYDAYQIEDTGSVSYQPGRPPRYPIVVTGGGGLMFDVSPELCVFLEPMWSKMVWGNETYRSVPDRIDSAPLATEAADSMLRVSAGLGVKF